MPFRRLLFPLLLTSVLAASNLEAKIIYVDEVAANPVAPYGTWETATYSLQDALSEAVSGDEVWVAYGTYYPDQGEFQTPNDRSAYFQLKNGVKIYGGFESGDSQLSHADPSDNETILSGDIEQDGTIANNSYHVLLATNVDASALLQGFTIELGNADALGSGFDTRGGGLYCFQASPTITDCLFLNNSATTFGGAVINRDSSSPIFTNCSFKSNQATSGGAMANDLSSSPEIINVEFLGNRASLTGGALFNQNSSAPNLLNCTFGGNQAGQNGGASYNANNANPTFDNCIVWNNQASGITTSKTASVFTDGTSVATYSHCLVENYSAANLSDGGPNLNFDSADPLFFLPANPANAPSSVGNLRLRSGSPALDQGSNPSPTTLKDLAGNSRITNSTIDLGAFEGSYFDILSWSLESPVDIDASSLNVVLTLSSGSLPTGWEEALEISSTGNASSYKETITGSGPAYTITLDGILGDGYFSISFNKIQTEAMGFHILGETGIENIQRLSSASTRHFVNSGNEFGNAPYDNWKDAAPNLQDALALAAPGDQIWVAKGTYYPDEGFGQTIDDRTATFQLVNGIEIYGGFAGGETELDDAEPFTNRTILSGDIGDEADASDNSYHILTAEAVDDSALLQGFVITDGNADGNDPHSQGSGIYIDKASPTIINCSFQGNSAQDFGGAIYNFQSSPFLTNCSFQGNYSNSQGGAIYNFESSPLLTNCTFQGNRASFIGGAIYNSSSTPSLVNCIIWNNESSGANNTADASLSNSGTGSPSFSYSLVANYNKSTLDAGSSPDTNLEPTDPRFLEEADPSTAPTADGDLRLRADSPLLDKGDGNGNDTSNTTSSDLAGNERVLNDTIDLGTFEGGVLSIATWDIASAIAVDATSIELNLNLSVELNELPDAVLASIAQTSIGSAQFTSIGSSGSGFAHTLTFTGLNGEGELTIGFDPALAQENGITFSGTPSITVSLKSTASKVHYVNQENTNSQVPYDTWGTASDNLQDALAYAVSGDQIWIAKGTYYPDIGELNIDNDRGESFLVNSGISIYGGFLGGETDVSEANSNKNFTTLSGEIQQDGDSTNNSYHVVTIRDTNGSTQPTLNGISIASGYADGLDSLKQNRGGALYCFDASPQLIYVYFYENYAELGGAVYNESESSPSFDTCYFRFNSAQKGGAVYNKSKSSPSFNTCDISINTAQEGGAIYNDSESSPELTASFLRGNLAQLGGGALFNFDRSAPTLTNCLIRGNRATNQQGGAIKNDNSSPKLFNCSIQGNRAGDEGGAFFNFNISSPELVNCIIWNNQSNDFTNQATSSVYNESGSVPSYSFCLVENYSKAELDAGASPDTNFAPVDPLFVKPAVLADTPTRVGDLSLKYGSPAIDVGSNPNPADPDAKDIFGNDRIQNSTIDLGPAEGANITATAWQLLTPLEADDTTLVAKLTLDGGTRPSTWKNAIKVSSDGSAITGDLKIVESDPDFVQLILSGLSGEGHITFSLDPDLAKAEGIIFLGQTSFESFLTSTTATPTHYVNAANANGEAPYDTWEKAAASLQDALAVAAPGDEVWVAQGTYYPDQGEAQTAGDRFASFQLRNGIAIYGGFAGGETGISAANPFTRPTILSGNIDGDAFNDDANSYHVVTAESTDETAQLHGFTITAGYAFDLENDETASGAGLYCKDASPTLTYCFFQANKARDGGAIYIESSSPKFTNCSFLGNTGTGGGAIYNRDASPVITNCSFQGNYASDWGGAVYNRQSSPLFTNCSFQGNYAVLDGGAIFNQYASAPEFTNCIIWNNGENGQTDTKSASVDNDDSGDPEKDTSVPIFSFCIVENYSKSELDAGDSPNTNFAPADPLFVLPSDPAFAPNLLVGESGAVNGLRLQYSSPAIDKGTNPNPLIDFDLAGNPRLINDKIDLGAYEGTVYEIDSWVLSDPIERGDTSLELTLTLKNGGKLPNDWQNVLQAKTTGSAAFGSSQDFGSGPTYIIVMNGLSGDGRITIAFDETLAKAKGIAFENNSSFQAILRSLSGGSNLYVNAANTASQAPYNTWETAANKLQDALDYAIPGDDVWVAQGTYYPDEGENQTDGKRTTRFNLKSDIGIYGGFAGGETLLSDADPASNLTTLSGDIDQDGEGGPNNSYHVVLANATNANAILDGFIIVGGYADDSESDNAGGGLYCKEGASPTISNCWFEGNFAIAGGAIGNKASLPNIVNCTFKSNVAAYGGAIYSYLDSTPTITHSSFQENTAIEQGGAIYNNSSDPVLINCALQGNNALRGGGAVYLANDSLPVFTNCSIQGNKAGDVGGAFGLDPDNSRVTLENSIIWDNQSYGSTSSRESSMPQSSFTTITNSLVENYSKRELDDYSGGANSNLVYADPRFFKEISPAKAPTSAANLRLTLGSPAIDAGKNADNSKTKDLAGNDRIQNSVIDVGAYEGGIAPERPFIVLNGKAVVTLRFDSAWTDPEATVTDNIDTDPTLVIGGDAIDSTKPGVSYTLTYDATDTDGNQAIQLTRTVTVANPTTPPVIVREGDAALSLAFGATWTEPGASATDATGASVAVTIAGDTVDSSNPGQSYTITYDATDIYGNVATQLTRTVTIGNPTTPPVIVLNGKSPMTIPFGAIWADPGTNASDATGAAVPVTIAGDTVDTAQTQGVFTITYNATDTYGNVAQQVTRQVSIVGVINFDPDTNNQLDQISWTDDWILQTSTDLKFWTDVPDAQSPLAITLNSEARRFWRLRKAD